MTVSAILPQAPGRAGYLLGFAAGGFFDGILLHQILQWHHLLSGLGGGMRFQVLADGYFHALMYAVAALGLWRLLRRPAPSTRRLVGRILVGFGVWHGVDAVLSHWILQIHRIRMDVGAPLVWDLGWLAVFGIAPLLVGICLLRSGPPQDPETSPGPSSAKALIALLVVVAGLQAARPAPGAGDIATIVFAPGVSAGQMFSALAEVEGRVVWAEPEQGLIAAQVAPQARLSLYRRGALLVSGAGLPPGCLDYLRAS